MVHGKDPGACVCTCQRPIQAPATHRQCMQAKHANPPLKSLLTCCSCTAHLGTDQVGLNWYVQIHILNPAQHSRASHTPWPEVLLTLYCTPTVAKAHSV